MAARRPSKSPEDAGTRSATSTPTPIQDSQPEGEVQTLAQFLADPYFIREISLVALTLTTIIAVDILILRNDRDGLRLTLTIGLNIVLLASYRIYHAIRYPDEKTGMTNTALSARRDPTVCGKENQLTTMRCLEVGSKIFTASSLGLAIANLVFRMSEKISCDPEEFDNANYNYAIRTKGSCHATAQRETIRVAIDHYIHENFDDKMCGVQCMKLTHGGNWQGYVVSGKSDYDWSRYLDMCASVSKLGQCESGEKKHVGDV